MRHRFASSMAALVSLLALAGLVSISGAAQEPGEGNTTGPSKTWTTPRTSWGHPDLQGVWTTDPEIGVPVERPVDWERRRC